MNKKIISIFTVILSVMMSLCNVMAADSITYMGDTNKIFSTTDDFFSEQHMNQMLPGDSYSGSASINNTSSDKVTMFFRTKPESKYSDTMSKQMLNDFNLTVTVTKGGYKKTVYNGKWSGDSKFVDIGTYAKGDKADFDFKVTIPKEHRNAFNMQKTSIRWIFVASVHQNKIVPVKTGDNSDIITYLCIAALAVALTILVVGARKRRLSKKMFAIVSAGALIVGVLSIPDVRKTLAYLSDGDEKNNSFIIGHNVSHIDELFPDGTQDPSGTFTRTKEFRVKNDNSVPCYVRARVEISDGDMERYINLNMDTTNWELGKDGYWYYKKVINPGQYTSYLFTRVSVNMSTAADVAKTQKDFDILTYEESTQARNAKNNTGNGYYSSPEEAFAAIS